MQLKRTHIILFLAIIASIIIRIPNLNRPLSKHHEFVTAHVLRVMQIWDEGGIASYHFSPVMNYAGASNKYINNQSMGYCDLKGDYYYLSYPSFAFILPYLVFEGLHIHISPLALEWFNILIHILSALVLYRIVLLLTDHIKKEHIALMAAVFFLINPCSLWFYGNVYFADMLVIFFWLAATWCLLLLKDERKYYLKMSLLGLAVLLGNYSEYLMLMFSLCAIVYVVISGYSRKALIVSLIVICTLIPYLLTIYQYSQIGGWESLLHQEISRYKSRSGYNYHNPFLATITECFVIGKNYILHYGPFIIIIMAGGFFLLRRNQWQLPADIKSILWLFIVPVVLHHVIFLNATMHDFQVLKSSVPICILTSFILYSSFPRGGLVIASLILIINIADYYYINRPGEYSRNGDKYADERIMGTSIKIDNWDNEVIFFTTDVSPQVVYYAHKNIFRYATKENAVNFLREHNLKSGILFYFNDQSDKPNHIISVERIHP